MEPKKNSLEPLFWLIGTVTLVMFFMGCGAICTSSSYEPASIYDANNKQLQDFSKWQHEQDQKKWDNQKPFK